MDELYIKHVIGYRGWDIVCVNDSWYLSSPFRKTIWPYKEPLIMKDDFPNYNKLWAEYFKNNPPCRTTIEINCLPTPIAIELKVIATL